MATARARASYTASVADEREAPDEADEAAAAAPAPGRADDRARADEPSALGDATTGASDATRPLERGDGLRSRAWRFLRRHRVRLARLALFAFAAIVLVDLSGVVPTAVRVVLPLGAEHAEAIAVAIDVLDVSGEPARSVRLRFADGAPATVEQPIELLPGRYVVHVDCERADGSRWSLEGALEAPADGAVRVALRRAP